MPRQKKQRRARTSRWDAAHYLDTPEAAAAYLAAALHENDPTVISAALGDIARARGMSTVARKSGLGRESLYKTLSIDGNPEFATILRVVRALGLELKAAPAQR
jgi:probable addiction module antidote protein